MVDDVARHGLTSPCDWYAGMAPPSINGDMAGASLRCFDGTSPTIEQPALDENVMAVPAGQGGPG
jgi:hypothetical protein